MISIEIVYALPERQTLLKLRVPVGTTVDQALATSRIISLHTDLVDLALRRVGIFGRIVARQHVLAAGDRIEIYRPLVADPKASRHARVAKRRAERGDERKMRG